MAPTKPNLIEPCTMTSYLHFSMENDCILFESWRVFDNMDYIVSCFILILLCITREYVIYAMKYYEIRSLTGRHVPFWPSNQELNELLDINKFGLNSINTLHSLNSIHTINYSATDNPLMTRSKIPRNEWRNPITLKLRIVDCFLYGISLILGYGLMLIIMSFNVGLMLIIVVGYCLGKFIFYKQTRLLSRYAVVYKVNDEFSSSDHCHVRS